MTKPAVRELARSMDLAVASKGDSQEICFVPNGDYAAFMSAYLKETGVAPEETRGEIVTSDGRRLGEHDGVHHFTVGQRQGLGISAPEPLYVIATEPLSQRVIVGQQRRSAARPLSSRRTSTGFRSRASTSRARAQVKIRNKHAGARRRRCIAAGDRVEVVFDEPQRAVTPGQGAVFYDGDLVLGGGWID